MSQTNPMLNFSPKWQQRYNSDHVKTTPDQPGVYLFIEVNFDEMTKKVVYVGKSTSLQKRLATDLHTAKLLWKIDVLTHKRDRSFLYVFYQVTGDLDAKEMRLIRRFKPKLNLQQISTSLKPIAKNGSIVWRDDVNLTQDFDGVYKFMTNYTLINLGEEE